MHQRTPLGFFVTGAKVWGGTFFVDICTSYASKEMLRFAHSFPTRAHLRLTCMVTVAIMAGAWIIAGSTRAEIATSRHDNSDATLAYPSPMCLFPDGTRYCLDIDAKEAPLLRRVLRAECVWTRLHERDVFTQFLAHDIVVNGSRMHGPLPYDALPRDLAPLAVGDNFGFERCASSGWDLLRIGPFVTAGGYYWPSVTGSFIHGLHAAWRAPLASVAAVVGGDHDAFEAYAIGSIDAEGRLYGYPPLHQHHFHFGSLVEGLTIRGRTAPAEIMGTHGENQCRDEEGGVDCYVRSAPLGIAHVERRPLGIVNSFNDVRPEGAVPLSSWLFVAVRVASSPPDRRISLTYLMVRPPPYESRGTYVIGTRLPSVSWHQGRVRAPMGSMIEAYFHAHAELVYDVWLFAGEDAHVFDDVHSMQSSRDRALYAPDVVPVAMANIRARRARSDAAPLRCAYKTSSFLDRIAVDGGREQIFQRKAPCALAGMGDGSAYVMVAFHAPPVDFPTPSARAHAYVKVYYAAPLTEAYRSDWVEVGTEGESR